MIPYFQSSQYTTAASALLIILHQHGKSELSKEKEFEIWHKSVNLPTRGSSIFALAKIAKEHGLEVKVVVQKKEYGFPDYRFYRYTKEDVEHAAFAEKRHLQSYEDVEERSFTLQDVKKELLSSVVLLRLNVKPIRGMKKNSSNYILVHGFADGYFQIIDPGFAALSVPEEVMQEAFDSLETKKYRDHRMLVFKNSF